MWRVESKAVTANEILLELLRRFNEEIEAYIETLEVLGDPGLMESIRRGLKDLEAGRTLSLKELAAKYGLETEI